MPADRNRRLAAPGKSSVRRRCLFADETIALTKAATTTCVGLARAVQRASQAYGARVLRVSRERQRPRPLLQWTDTVWLGV